MAEKKECEHCRGTGRYYNQDYSSNYTGPVCSYCNGHGYIMVEYDSSSSSSYTPSSSGGSSGFNYAGDVKDFEKIMHHAYDLIDTGNFDAAIDVAGRLADSFTWEEKLVKIANSVLKNAKSRKAEAEAQAQRVKAEELSELGDAADDEGDTAKAIELWTKAADMGDVIAQCNLGYTYLEGDGVPVDLAKAKEWYQKAAAQGDEGAIRHLKELEVSYASANEAQALVAQGVAAEKARDPAKAAELYRKAAEMGDSEAQKCLGFLYAEGMGVKQDLAKAIELYRKAAEQGHTVAQNIMGEAYLNGEGVPQDYAKAKEWFEKAAAQDSKFSKVSLCNLGLLYRDGLGVKQDFAKAEELFKKAIAKGYDYAQEELDTLNEMRGEESGSSSSSNTPYTPEAQKILDDINAGRPADLDHLCNCATSYWFGSGGNHPIDKAKSIELYTIAANKGHTFAMTELGERYRDGLGVKKDLAKAKEWYGKAAALGDEDAKEELAKLK